MFGLYTSAVILKISSSKKAMLHIRSTAYVIIPFDHLSVNSKYPSSASFSYIPDFCSIEILPTILLSTIIALNIPSFPSCSNTILSHQFASSSVYGYGILSDKYLLSIELHKTIKSFLSCNDHLFNLISIRYIPLFGFFKS